MRLKPQLFFNKKKIINFFLILVFGRQFLLLHKTKILNFQNFSPKSMLDSRESNRSKKINIFFGEKICTKLCKESIDCRGRQSFAEE